MDNQHIPFFVAAITILCVLVAALAVLIDSRSKPSNRQIVQFLLQLAVAGVTALFMMLARVK